MNGNRVSSFPALAGLKPEARALLGRKGQPIAAPAGAVMFQPGAECGNLLFLLSGTVRVQMVAENGREIVFYRVTGGEACVMTTACLMAHKGYGAEGVAETDIEAVAIPEAAFRDWLATSAALRDFVFTAFGTRLADLMVLIEEVAFRRLDLRLADLLLKCSGDGGAMETTHQELAVELGSVREVVSRVVKEFERKGWIALARGRVTVEDGAALQGYVQSLAA
ncbi:MAG: Crp/Fnr family transcriptional regulator [Rhodospirillaceae bacterium]